MTIQPPCQRLRFRMPVPHGVVLGLVALTVVGITQAGRLSASRGETKVASAGDEPQPEAPRISSWHRPSAPVRVPARDGSEMQGPLSADRTVRLNVLNATWAQVLQKLADATGSQLVMQQAPKGRYSRFDANKYSRTDAVRILNRELEPLGFRLLEQGRFLVVLQLDALRTRYQRPVVPTVRGQKSEVGGQKTEVGGQRSADGDALVQTPRELPSASQAVQVSSALASHRGVKPAAAKSVDASGGSESETVRLHHRSATDVARIIYTALKPRAELIDHGPHGLPAFVVYDSERNAEPGGPVTGGSAADPLLALRAVRNRRFTVGIDVDREELVVSASPKWSQRVTELIGLLDTDAGKDHGALRLIASEKDTERIAEVLRPALERMTTRLRLSGQVTQVQREGESQRTDSKPPPPQAPRPQGEQPQPQQTPDQEPLLRIDALRGPVTIQDVPGIGLVVTGNREDVDAVVRIIRELERVAGGTVPDIHLLMLRHVNSQALASLLNNVYERLTAIRSVGVQTRPSASIIPVAVPNAILIVASKGDLQAILDLAEKLDQPVDPGTEFQVFPLKNAIASQVASTLESLYAGQQQQQQQEGEMRIRVRAVADARTNSVIVEAAPRDLEAVTRLIHKIDRDSSGSVSRVQVFPLQNAVAEELSEVLNTALQSVLNPSAQVGGQVPGQVGVGGAAGQSAQQLRDVKSVVLEFLTTDGNAQNLIRSGILADIRVTADPRVNALIVTAPEQSMKLMAELIRQLDQPPSAVAEIKVFTLTNSDATAMADLLQTLFQTEQQQQQGQQQLGIQVAGAENASSSLIPLRISVDVRTNSIIAMGGSEALRVVEAILLRLDETDVRERQTTVIRLKNSPVTDVANAINAFLQSQRDLAQIDPELVSNIELLEREIIVVPEPVTNTLLISATPRYYKDVLEIVSQLDQSPAQVIIQVLIVEVQLDQTDEFGVELGFQDSVLFNRGLLNLENFRTIQETATNIATGVSTTTEQIVNQETVPGFLFNNQPLGNNTAVHPGAVGTQGLSNFSLGRVNGDLGFGGLVLSASSEEISVLMRALAARRNVHILSRPQIRTLDNQLASIQVGQQVPVIAGVTTNALGGISPALGTPQQVGIILQVTPRISPDGTIVMETIANKSDISGQGVPIFTDPTTGGVVESPIFDLTEARATVAVPDGQTVVLGGMITKQDDTLERKVPWLGDLPYVGTAFRYDSTTTRRTELLIFMTPRIIKNDVDSELIKQVEAERIHFLQQEAEEVHGPIFAVPPQTSAPPQPSREQSPSPMTPPADESSGAPLLYDQTGAQSVPTTIMPAEPQSFSLPEGAQPVSGGFDWRQTRPDIPSFPGSAWERRVRQALPAFESRQSLKDSAFRGRASERDVERSQQGQGGS